MIALTLIGLPLALAALALLLVKPMMAPGVIVGAGGMAVLYRWPALALLMMGALVPFEGLFTGQVTGAKLVGLALIVILALRFVLRQIPNEDWQSPLWPILIAFMTWYLLSLWKSDLRLLSISTLKDLLVGLILFVSTLIFAPRMSFRHFGQGIALSVAATCVIAFATKDHQVEGRAIGLLSDPNYFALLVVVALPLGMLTWLQRTELWWRLGWGVVMVILLAGLVQSGSRSALMVTLMSTLMGLWHHRRRLVSFKPRHAGFVLLGILIMLPVAYKALPDDYLKHIQTLMLLKKGVDAVQDPSLGRRTSYLVVGSELVKSHPWLGTGPGTFPVHYAQSNYAAAFSFEPDRSDLFRPAHNTYMQLLAETGIPGGGLFAALVGAALLCCLKARRRFLLHQQQENADLAAHYGLSMLGMALFLMFLSIPNHKYLWMLLALSSVLYQRAKRSRPVEASS
ncbi:O-antigen ligase family protein [Pokkaliibacter sp. CJK22405]|uniref:O-antigen ligase family protein n=1 Tax=Pokkaliibacter sp. CJK22405 TaxID=3384615 RepID=UPI0039847B8E